MSDMTRYLAPIGALLLASLLLARGQSADERYIWIYTMIQEADSMVEKGSKAAAADKYSEAQVSLKELQKLYPDWNQKVVNYRLGYVGDRLQILALQLPPPNPATKLNATASVDANKQPGPTNAPVAQVPPEQLKGMQDELSRLTSQNELLQAKLKEAQTVQPSGSDPRELAKAEEQIRTLQKERELLKTQLEQAKTVKGLDPAVLEQERVLVAELQQKLLRQTELATALQEENRTLKLRVEDLKYAAALPANKASEQLEITKNLLSALQATNVTLRSEQILLEAKLSEISKGYVGKAQVDRLARENEELRKKLELAQKGGGAPSTGTTSNQVEEQLKIARARLEALEAKAVPYTPEELALFKAPDKNIEVAAVKPVKKQNEIPAGAGPLVFEAQRALDAGHFDEAEKKYQDVLRQDEKNTYTLVRLAAVQIEQHR